MILIKKFLINILLATNTGSIRVIHINKDNEQIISYYDISVHSGRISKLAISSDDNLIFSCSVDGCLAIINLKESNINDNSPNQKQKAKKYYSEEVIFLNIIL